MEEMRFKHKFYLEVFETGETLELATCRDFMTANMLADHYRKLYSDESIHKVIYKHNRKEKTL